MAMYVNLAIQKNYIVTLYNSPSQNLQQFCDSIEVLSFINKTKNKKDRDECLHFIRACALILCKLSYPPP